MLPVNKCRLLRVVACYKLSLHLERTHFDFGIVLKRMIPDFELYFPNSSEIKIRSIPTRDFANRLLKIPRDLGFCQSSKTL